MKKVLLLLALAGSLFLFSEQVKAQNDCKVIYGGGEDNCLSQNIEVDSKIMNTQGNYFDSLSEAERLSPRGDVSIRISVTNRGSAVLNEIDVVNTLPRNTTYTSGPGTYNRNNNTLTFRFNNLRARESRTFDVKANINQDTHNSCVENRVRVKSGDSMDQDTSRFCIAGTTATTNNNNTKSGLPVKPAPKGISKTPSTGPSAIVIAALVPLLSAGIYLKRKSI
jgi:uncharacterized repeat protein (TIGR01451 family)